MMTYQTWKSEKVVEGHCLGSVKVVRAYERGICCLQRMQLASKYLIGRNSRSFRQKVTRESLFTSKKRSDSPTHPASDAGIKPEYLTS